LRRRVCENCRFFQEAGVAKSGWCNNPLRKESSDVKLVVRRNELACRNGWAQDLFSARTDDLEAADIVLHDTVSLRPLPPASGEETTLLANSQRDKPSEPMPPPVDVVVGEAPSPKPAPERASLLGQDPRSAILKARERYRARMSAERRRDDGIPPLDDRAAERGGTLAPVSPIRRDLPPNPLPPLRQPRGSEVPPVQLSEVSRDFPTITSFPGDEDRFSSIPDPVEGVVLPRAFGIAPERAEAVTEESGASPVSVDNGSLSATTSDSDEPPAAFGARDAVPHDRRRPQREEIGYEDDAFSAVEPEEVAAYEGRRVDKMERRRFDFGRRRRDDQRFTGVEEAAFVVAETAVVEEDWIDDGADRPLLDEFVAEVNPIVEIAPDVPRMCRTCRDFRPADSGERGWCTNKWAFSHRRMVDADELPCETSVGCWWLPHDDVWLATADVSAHGQPTPLVDYWLAHKVGSATAETGDQRRRQRS
jgi:hypothetical protein